MSNRRNQDPFEPERRKRRARRREPENVRDDAQSDSTPRRRRWPIVVLVLLLIVALLPNLIGWFGLHNQFLPYAIGDFQGNVNIRQASLGWFQSIELNDVTATDLAGNPLASVAQVKTSKPLYALLTGSDYGEVDIHKPVVYYHVRQNGSNLEDAVSRYIASSQPSPLKSEVQNNSEPFVLPKMLIRVHEGSALITAEGNPRTWQIDSLSVAAAISEPQAPLAATAQLRAMSLMPDANGQLVVEESGTIEQLKLAFDVGADQLSFSTATVELETKQFPISIAAPLGQRIIGPATMGGSASSQIKAAWNGTTSEVEANIASLQLSNPQIYAPQLLNEDQFFVDQLSARGAMQLSPRRISADQFVVETDFGRLDANGDFDPGQIAKLSQGGQLPDSTLQMEGEIDIAKLLQRLPSTFQLHKDLTVESGTIQFSAGQQNGTDARRLIFNVDTANVRANRGGQPIVWQQPLRLVGVLRESSGQFSIESLECISDFLNINGTATLREGMFRVSGNLGELSQRIRQFADLGPMQFAGSLDGQFGWKIVGENQINVAQLVNQPIQIGGEFTVNQPVIEMTDLPRWSPDKIVIRTSGSGQLSGTESSSSMKLSQAGAQLEVGNETAILSLARPIEDAFTNQQWVFNTQVTGQVEGWLQHLRNFVDPGDFQAGGTLNFAGITIVDPNQIRVENGQYEIKQLGFEGYGAKIREDRVVGSVTADYAIDTGNVGVQQGTLQGSGISATAQNLKLTISDAMQLDGAAAWRADINRMAEWYSLSPAADSINWFGAVEGNVDFKSSASGTDASFRADLTDLVATQQATATDRTSPMQMVSKKQAWTELWREPKVNLNGQVTLGSDFNSLAIHGLTARSGSLDFDSKGTISDLAGSLVMDLEGSWQPNFDKINSLLAAYSQDMVELGGTGIQPYRIQGPLFADSAAAWVSEQLIVQTIVGWDRGQLAGLPIGKSDLAVELQRQVATLRTNESGIPVSGGTVNLQPQLDLRGNDPVLVHGAGRVLNSVQVTPEICRDCLKFVAPWLSDTTNAQGVFSADIQGMSMPLFNPQQASARGTLVMQDVTVAAGPMAEQLLGTVSQIQAILKPDSRERELKTWLKIEQQSIPLAVENGRVFHEGIKFSHNELIIRTSGSVGFDQTVNLVAKIPIADEWIDGNQYLAGLKGQSISIPVGGTVDRPVIDKDAVQKLSTDLVRNAAQGAIGNAITDKVNPKLNEYRNELNEKVGGEMNKLQNKFQDKLGGFLQDKLGAPASGNSGQNAVPSQTPQASPGQQLEDRLNGELQKGFNKLFGG
ncbi:translocation/assembly module TamB domain-containing protein [Mariniblastus fucicola]|uniref:Uncharacterized protein n=1 Tax=Mariniblastus fucicola TaxID=980251 RepID=A0A5B9P5T2_9BACT|nr:hypothetical protein [Mariniblastus fucicola]QEG20535.1 hypothetical protein MFFC18_03840 [Mariniblastus fucicola]